MLTAQAGPVQRLRADVAAAGTGPDRGRCKHEIRCGAISVAIGDAVGGLFDEAAAVLVKI